MFEMGCDEGKKTSKLILIDWNSKILNKYFDIHRHSKNSQKWKKEAAKNSYRKDNNANANCD